MVAVHPTLIKVSSDIIAEPLTIAMNNCLTRVFSPHFLQNCFYSS